MGSKLVVATIRNVARLADGNARAAIALIDGARDGGLDMSANVDGLTVTRAYCAARSRKLYDKAIVQVVRATGHDALRLGQAMHIAVSASMCAAGAYQYAVLAIGGLYVTSLNEYNRVMADGWPGGYVPGRIYPSWMGLDVASDELLEAATSRADDDGWRDDDLEAYTSAWLAEQAD